MDILRKVWYMFGSQGDDDDQSLKWSKINTISSIVIGLLAIVATVLVAKFF